MTIPDELKRKLAIAREEFLDDPIVDLYAHEYAEPGYANREIDERTGLDGLIVFANWNETCKVCRQFKESCSRKQATPIGISVCPEYGPQEVSAVASLIHLIHEDHPEIIPEIGGPLLDEMKVDLAKLKKFLEERAATELEGEVSDLTLKCLVYPEPHEFVGTISSAFDHALDEAGITPEERELLAEELEDDPSVWFNIEGDWSDEYCLCDECMRAVRTSADCYEWTPNYFASEDGDRLCADCTQRDPEWYLKQVVNQLRNSDLVDPEEHGFIHVTKDHYDGAWENGLHECMAAEPGAQLGVLNDAGFDVLFKIGASQFYTYWTLYVRPTNEDGELDFSKAEYSDELRKTIVDQVRELISSCGECEMSPTPAEMMKSALQEVTTQSANLKKEQAKKGGIIHTTVEGDKATTKLVSREEFKKGEC